MNATEALRRKAYEAELDQRSCEERGEDLAAALNAAVAIALYQVAEALDDEPDDE